MLSFGITTVDKTFRIECKVIGEGFLVWFDLKGDEVTTRRLPGQIMRANKYVEENGNVCTVVIRKIQFVDGGNYTCRGDKTVKISSLIVECNYHLYDGDDDYYFKVKAWGTVIYPPILE